VDILYFEDGYYEGQYFVYTADVIVGFTPYIDAGYLDQTFFEDRGGAFSLTGSLTRLAFLEFTAGLTSAFVLSGSVGKLQITTATMSSAFTVTATVVKTARIQKALTSAVTVATVSVKTARSSVTLSTIANLSAQAARFRDTTSSVTATATVSATVIKTTQTSPSLSSQSTVTVTAQRFRSSPATLSSAATQTASSIISARASIALTSAFSPVITAIASVSNGSNLQSSFTLSALTGVTRQFPLNLITGVGLDIANQRYPKVMDFDQTQFPTVNAFNIREQAWTFSIWVKRYSRSGVDETIAATDIQPSSNSGGGITFKNSNIRIRFGADLDVVDTQWVNVAPNNTDWHHYLFRSDASITDISSPPLVRRWLLWVDGVYKGASSTHQPNLNNYPSEFNWCGRFSGSPTTLQGGVLLGYESFYAAPGEAEYPGGIGARPLDGAFGQLWMGRVSASEFRVERFYSGLRDLGDTGTATGLPTPVFYNRLTTPYTGVTWENGGASIASTEYLLKPSVEALFTVTGSGTNVVITTASLSSAFTQSSTAFRTLRFAAALTSQFSVTATLSKFTRFVASMSSAVTQTTVGQRVRFADSSLSSAFTVTATAFKVKPYAAAVTSVATVTATIDNRTRSQAAAITARFTVSATIDDRTRDAISLEAGAFTLTATVTRTKALGSEMSAAFTQTATPSKVIISVGNFTARFTIAPIVVYRVIIGQANLSASGFVLTQGDILNFDPCREIKVDQETRLARILPENRLLIVDSETRALKVPQETRVLKVDSETRVNITQC
jgi:hypothetical protein